MYTARSIGSRGEGQLFAQDSANQAFLGEGPWENAEHTTQPVKIKEIFRKEKGLKSLRTE
ncbi:hypothetical protein APTSU1_001423000 [Apodemus speciosus]|uniref:Uncharacterized protein n=1 Tax=Apodemus speciosus TaxID=105296 RepID=A0ABQ0FIC2_APOSI